MVKDMEHKTSSNFTNAKKATLAASGEEVLSRKYSKCSLCLRLGTQETDPGYDHMNMIQWGHILCRWRCEAKSLVCWQVRVGAGGSSQSVKYLSVKWTCPFPRVYNLWFNSSCQRFLKLADSGGLCF